MSIVRGDGGLTRSAEQRRNGLFEELDQFSVHVPVVVGDIQHVKRRVHERSGELCGTALWGWCQRIERPGLDREGRARYLTWQSGSPGRSDAPEQRPHAIASGLQFVAWWRTLDTVTVTDEQPHRRQHGLTINPPQRQRTKDGHR